MAWYSKATDWIKKNVFRIKENIETSNIDSKNSIKPEAQEEKVAKKQTIKKREDVITTNYLYEPSNTFDKKGPFMENNIDAHNITQPKQIQKENLYDTFNNTQKINDSYTKDPKELESIYSTPKKLKNAKILNEQHQVADQNTQNNDVNNVTNLKNNAKETKQTPNYKPKLPEPISHRAPPPVPHEDKQSEKQPDTKPRIADDDKNYLSKEDWDKLTKKSVEQQEEKPIIVKRPPPPIPNGSNKQATPLGFPTKEILNNLAPEAQTQNTTEQSKTPPPLPPKPKGLWIG